MYKHLNLSSYTAVANNDRASGRRGLRTESLDKQRPSGAEAEFLKGFCPDLLVIQMVPIHYCSDEEYF